jgi:hypothetical protein
MQSPIELLRGLLEATGCFRHHFLIDDFVSKGVDKPRYYLFCPTEGTAEDSYYCHKLTSGTVAISDAKT